MAHLGPGPSGGMSEAGESRQTTVEQLGRFCDGFRMTAHLRRCHEHRGRRPKAAKEGKRGEWGSSGAAGSMEIWRREVVLRAGHFPPPPGLTRTTFPLWHGPC